MIVFLLATCVLKSCVDLKKGIDICREGGINEESPRKNQAGAGMHFNADCCYTGWLM